MVNNIWAFGCSFTDYAYHKGEPIWVSPGDGVYEISQKEASLHWLRVLQQKLIFSRNLYYGVQQRGWGGVGRQGVLRNVLFFLQDYKPGDVVVIGVTTHSRLDFITEYDRDKRKIVNRPFWLYDAEEALGLADYPLSDWKKIGSRDERRVIAEYFMELHDPDKGKDTLAVMADKFNSDTLYSIAGMLRRLDIEVYLWDYTLWMSDVNGVELVDNSTTYRGLGSGRGQETYFETIENWAKGVETGNGHWSPNGSYKAGNFFHWCIERGCETFDKKYLKEFDLEYKDSTYLEFESNRIIYKEKVG